MYSIGEEDNWIERMTAGTVIEHIDREWINGPSGTVQTDCVIWGAVHVGLRDHAGFNSEWAFRLMDLGL